MFIRSNRSMAIALVSCMAISYAPASYSASYTYQGTDKNVAALASFAETLGKEVVKSPFTFQSVLEQVKNNPALYSSLFITALMVYRFESKGPCESVSYDFNTIMRSNDSYVDKLKKAVAWFDRYVIGQPYKSKSVKAKDGDLVISDSQEALGLMGVAQSNLKPALVGLGSAYFLNDIANGCKSKDKLDGMGWALLAIIFGLK